jgi:hypothetical protein
MKTARLISLIAAPLALAGCVAPVGPVEVTRFHEPAAIGQLAQGTIAVVPAPGIEEEAGDSLEFASYRTAIASELQGLGYRYVTSPNPAQVAELRIERIVYRPGRDGGPVTVGGGASTGSYGSGVGVGIGIDLSGPPPEQVTTEMQVMIRDRSSGRTLWEGRASFTVRADSPLAGTQLGAPKLAAALFRDFPGNNGETVEVR